MYFIADTYADRRRKRIKDRTQKHLDYYARDGLRTLCIAKKVGGHYPNVVYSFDIYIYINIFIGNNAMVLKLCTSEDKTDTDHLSVPLFDCFVVFFSSLSAVFIQFEQMMGSLSSSKY